MSDEFDRDLQDRLARLVAAVPVAGPRATQPAGPGSLRGGGAARRVALAWILPLLTIAIATAMFLGRSGARPTVSGVGPTDGSIATAIVPSPFGSPDSPFFDWDSAGPYRIELHSERRLYRETDVIDAKGVFVYTGETAVDVSGLKLFRSIAEPVYGIPIGDILTMDCVNQTLEPGEHFDGAFHQAGGVSGNDPLQDFKRAYLMDPVFRLPPGTWHLKYDGSLFEGTCRAQAAKQSFSTEIEIVVLPVDGAAVRLATASEPNPTGLCHLALAGGKLAPDPRTGLGFEGKVAMDVVWPFGYTARREGDSIVLLDDAGRFVARTGDQIAVGGGSLGLNTFNACSVGPRQS